MLTEKTIHELTAAYRSGETTPTAVAEAYLARIAKLDREVGAYLMVTGEQALEAAAGAAARYRAGAPRSALDGVPVALKDRSEERRVGKSVDLGGRRIIKKKNKNIKMIQLNK